MKKQAWIYLTLIALLAALSVGLWQRGERERTKQEVMCKASVNAAREHFAAYQAKQDDADYIAGVAEFRSYMTTYLCLIDEASQAEYLWCNALYGEMILQPEKVKAKIHALTEAFEYLAEDYDDPNGFQQISALANELTNG